MIKWITNLGGTNGYIMVSATNPQDVRLVQSLNGKQIKIVYQEEAYFLQDLQVLSGNLSFTPNLSFFILIGFILKVRIRLVQY